MPRFNPLKSAKAGKTPRPESLPENEAPSPAPVANIPSLTENEDKDGFELRFAAKPSEAVLALFRATKNLPVEQRWHWHFRKHFWYARRNAATRQFAAQILAGTTGLFSISAPLVVAAVQPPTPEIEPNVISVNFLSGESPAQTVVDASKTTWRTCFPRQFPRGTSSTWDIREL
jgi:hypothetical protein